MICPTTQNLLRRTAAAFAAFAAILLATPASALTVTLTGASGNTCTYTGMTVDPNGNVSVNCSGGPITPGAPGSFSVSAGSMNVSSTATATVTRAGGATGAVAVAYLVSGASCTGASGTLNFADGSSASQTFAVTSNATAGTCTVAITTNPTGLTGTASVTITVAAPAPPPPTGVPGCPATPADMLTANLPAAIGTPLIQMQASGQIVSMPMPAVAPGTYSGSIVFGESAGGAYTPQPVTLEISINKCPGVINTDTTNYCNMKSPNGSYNTITWFGKPYPGIATDAATAQVNGLCWAPESDGQYYLNARWTYQSCAFGAKTCGFAIQHSYGWL